MLQNVQSQTFELPSSNPKTKKFSCFRILKDKTGISRIFLTLDVTNLSKIIYFQHISSTEVLADQLSGAIVLFESTNRSGADNNRERGDMFYFDG